MDDVNSLLLVMLAMFLVPVGIGAVLSLWALPAWLRATATGAQLTVFEVVGMKLRRIDVDAVAGALAFAEEEGAPVSHVDLQRAWQAGADLPKLAEAWVAARRRDMAISFEQLAKLYCEGRIGEVLPGDRTPPGE